MFTISDFHCEVLMVSRLQRSYELRSDFPLKSTILVIIATNSNFGHVSASEAKGSGTVSVT